ncbi:putative PAP-specific phosphatase, mitochondrial isoform X2 [Asparagus officinalis]|uniref:putative PAP-specific phosphatase, mitochondrial isoform X2 n=1 Tax=Asparagus officinalis TaxID=4686 RepID=UPI00098E4082|nr:putative PAP-specific phosphatase, mitochondrial isoform X2 [Asparagus officinalis]
MSLVHPYAPLPLSRRFNGPLSSRFTRASCSSSPIRSSLPFSSEKAGFFKEAEVAVDAVERACRLCVDVKRTLLSNDHRILEKNDQTPVTIADFSVQALISLELKRSFPSIPLVAEEDSSFLRSGSLSSQKDGSYVGNFLVDSIVSTVADKASSNHEPLTSDGVLEAIDRGGKDAVSFGSQPATYWVLDPIDGTRGFLKGSDALYVVGLALVVEGKLVLGIMGCPNWKEKPLSAEDHNSDVSEFGIIMVSHVGCGTWTRTFLKHDSNLIGIEDVWERCFVDSYHLVHSARFCIPDSQTWEMIPLSVLFSSTLDPYGIKDEHEILLIPKCCGSLCKYMMVASGRASVFILRARAKTVIKVWDHAVGVICVKESGGQVTDWSGDPLDLAADTVDRRIIFPSVGVRRFHPIPTPFQGIFRKAQVHHLHEKQKKSFFHQIVVEVNVALGLTLA